MFAAFLLLSFLFTVTELYLRCRGIFLPLLPCWIFYLAVFAGWRKGVAAGIFLGLVMDLLTASSLPVQMFVFPCVVIPARVWLTKVESDSLTSHLLYGAILPLIVYLPQMLCVSLQCLLRFLPYMIPLCMFSAILLPCMILFLDSLAERFGFPLYANVKLQLKRGTLPL